MLGFEPLGQGEHQWLWLEKRGQNTPWVAEQLARYARCSGAQVGYSGLKDRHAVTRQWFSLPRALPESAVPLLREQGIEILRTLAHDKKLKRGTHKKNRFQLCVRDLLADHAQLEVRLQRLAIDGVPNYFGEQRFGINGQNLDRCLQLPNLRKVSKIKKGLYLSAGRAFLFNRVLSQRITQGTWNQAMQGDLFNLDGTNSYFKPDEIDEQLTTRLKQQDIHPTGPLWGKGEPQTTGPVLQREQDEARAQADLVTILEQEGLQQQRRALRVRVEDLDWNIGHKELKLSFTLRAGSFATAVLRELLDYRDMASAGSAG